MAIAQGYGRIVTDGLVFGYDVGDSVNSYIGQPTTNTMRRSNDVTGVDYGFNNEYDTCQLTKVYHPEIKTPIGFGATLLSEQDSGNSPWYGLNWFDSDEDGRRCLSAYIYPVTDNIELRFGMVGDGSNSVSFDLNTRVISYGPGISNTNAFIEDVSGYPGWLRVGANIEGRGGGWVAFLGTGYNTSYSPSSPFQSFYVCGIQYERGIAPHCTQFTPANTSRSATQGLLPLIGNSEINLSNVSFNSSAQIVFDGSDDRLTLSPSTYGITNQFTIEVLCYPTQQVNGMFNFVGPNGSDRGMMAHWPWSDDYGYFDLTNTSGGFFRWYKINAGILNVKALYQFVLDTSGNVSVRQNNEVMTPSETDVFNGNVSLGDSNTIGAFYTNGGLAWAGNIYIFKIYNRALTAGELTRNYNHYKTRFNLN
jgi:hypothetical protein